jgi:ABC-type sugar transport system ATPase subunit
MVEIAKAVSRDVRVLCMDEPTDVLTGRETEVLFELVRRLTADGVAILYVSHKLDEIKVIADRVTILRDGDKIGTFDVTDLTPADMARRMVGRDLSDMYPERRGVADDASVALSLERVTVPGYAEDVTLSLRRGEVLGVAGLVGAGRTELFEGVIGLRPKHGVVPRTVAPSTGATPKTPSATASRTSPRTARARGCCCATACARTSRSPRSSASPARSPTSARSRRRSPRRCASSTSASRVWTSRPAPSRGATSRSSCWPSSCSPSPTW